MSRLSGRVLWTVAAMAIVVAAAQVAEAQREGGRRGGGRGFGFGLAVGGFGDFGSPVGRSGRRGSNGIESYGRPKGRKLKKSTISYARIVETCFKQGGGGEFPSHARRNGKAE